MNSKNNDIHKTFEKIRQIDEQGNEFWLARQLSKVLGYSEFRHFLQIILGDEFMSIKINLLMGDSLRMTILNKQLEKTNE